MSFFLTVVPTKPIIKGKKIEFFRLYEVESHSVIEINEPQKTYWNNISKKILGEVNETIFFIKYMTKEILSLKKSIKIKKYL